MVVLKWSVGWGIVGDVVGWGAVGRLLWGRPGGGEVGWRRGAAAVG